MIETRLSEYFEAQSHDVPQPEDRLSAVVRRGRRRRILRGAGVTISVAATLVVATIGSGWIFGAEPAVAASPFSGNELAVIHEAPMVLQGKLGPQPRNEPSGVDLSFTPINEPTRNDLAAIEELIRSNRYTDPVVVALGRIEAFETNVYALHDVDQTTGRGHTSIVGIGPDYPSFTSHSGRTEDPQWAFSANRSPDGEGRIAMRVPDFASWQYIQVEVGGEASWQRPSDGFIWLPFDFEPTQVVTVTGHHPETGEVLLKHVLDPIDDEPEEAGIDVP